MFSRANWQPTFIGIGAAKCATTWCWEALRHHPDIDIAQPKEIDFFRMHFDRGVAWYAKHFRHPERPVRGEITPLYMDDPRVAGRIRRTFPHVKLLVVLRNPFERAVSNLMHDIRDLDGGVATTTLERARSLAASDPKYLRRSLYAQQLRPFVESFAPKQLAVLFHDDLRQNAVRFAGQLYSAVGADSAFTPPQGDAPVNRTQDYRWPRAFKSLQMASRAANALPPTRAALRWMYRRTPVREWTLAQLAVDRGQPRFDFVSVFGISAAAAIAADVEDLGFLLPQAIPAAWRQSAPLSHAA